MRRALAEPHKLVLAVRMAACVQAEAGSLDAAEWQRLLHGSPDVTGQLGTAEMAPPAGLPHAAWAQIQGLESLPSFQVLVLQQVPAIQDSFNVTVTDRLQWHASTGQRSC